MASPVTAITGPLTVNSSGDARALALKIFSGELLAAFERMSNVIPTLMTKTIAYGNSAQFPAFGRVSSGFHVRGANILTDGSYLKKVNSVERLILVDELAVAPIFVPSLDEMLSHFETRGIYVAQLAEALARMYDNYAIRQIVRSARTNTTTDSSFIPTDLGDSQGGGGFVTTTATTGSVTSTIGGNFLTSLHSAAYILDTKHVPREGRKVIVPPSIYWSLVLNKDLLNQDYGAGNGIFFQGTVAMAAGFELIESTNIPSTVISSATTGEKNDYRGDFEELVAVAYHPSAAGVVKRQDITLETAYREEYQGDLVLAKMLAGVGRLRPEAAVEISTLSTQPILDGTDQD